VRTVSGQDARLCRLENLRLCIVVSGSSIVPGIDVRTALKEHPDHLEAIHGERLNPEYPRLRSVQVRNSHKTSTLRLRAAVFYTGIYT
jgi:hypothetical protein